jgi:FKBP-type peptidyl-prolyl cis-trans isomerase
VSGAAPQGGAEGLRFYDLSAGSGVAAADGDTVSMRYQAWLADGTPLGSAMGDPIVLVLDETTAPGIRSGLQGVTPGAKRKLIVPAAVGIGFDPLGTVPAGSTVVMDIDVVDVRPARPTQATAEAN